MSPTRSTVARRTAVSRRILLLGAGGVGASAVTLSSRHRRTGRPSVMPRGGRGQWVAAEGVALVAASRWSTSPGDHHDHEHARPVHGRAHQVHAESPTGHAVWTDTVLVDLSIRNRSPRPVLMSAGQFRLRVDGGPTVSYHEAQHRVRAIAPGRSLTTRIAFLAPPGAETVSLEYAQAGTARPMTLPLHPVRPQVGS